MTTHANLTQNMQKNVNNNSFAGHNKLTFQNFIGEMWKNSYFNHIFSWTLHSTIIAFLKYDLSQSWLYPFLPHTNTNGKDRDPWE